MFPDQLDLLDHIPFPSDLNIGKLYDGGSVMTDTCDKAQKEQCLLAHIIKVVAQEMCLNDNEISTYELDCLFHFHNVWFGAVIKQLPKMLLEFTED